MEIKLNYKFNSKLLLLALFGATMATCSLLMILFNPVSLIFKKVLTMAPGSIILNIWSAPPAEVLIEVYIFNVTNHEAFLAGTEKIRVVQAGPYVYQETLTNTNITFNENGTMTYYPRRALKFRMDLSVGDVEVDWLISPNIPLVGIQASLQHESFVRNMVVASISSIIGSKSFNNLTVYEYLWGYDDRLVTLANRALPGWINFARFGIMDRLMALDNGSNVVTVNLAPERKIEGPLLTELERAQPFHIHRWNGSPGLPHWGYVETEGNETSESNTRCNTLEGAMEGTVFPGHLSEKSSFKMYRRAFCRPVEFLFDEKVTVEGYEGYKFRVNPLFLARPEENPENACYCPNGRCLLKGLGSLANCYYDIPIAISQPHFYNADPILLEQVDGMTPNKEEHDSHAVIHPQIGVPLTANLRIQINLDVGQTTHNARTRPFNDLVLPLFWLQMRINGISPILRIAITTLVDVLPILQEVLIYLMGLGGLAMISGAAVLTLFFQKEEPNGRLSFSRGDYSPIPILPISKQYLRTDLRICK